MSTRYARPPLRSGPSGDTPSVPPLRQQLWALRPGLDGGVPAVHDTRAARRPAVRGRRARPPRRGRREPCTSVGRPVSGGGPSGRLVPPGQRVSLPRFGRCKRRPHGPQAHCCRSRSTSIRTGQNNCRQAAKVIDAEQAAPPDPVSRANQAVAFARISRSSRSRRFSRRSRRISSRSSVRRPSVRSPASRPACATQFRMAWADGSNSRARASGVRPDRTSSTICRRNSAAYGGLDFGIADTSSSQQDRCPRNRGNSINNKLRVIARRAYGFHSPDALISMLFLCCGGIELAPPLPTRI